MYKQCNEYLKNKFIFSLDFGHKSRLMWRQFQKYKKVIDGIEPMIISTISSVILKLRGIMEIFYDALCYIAFIIEVKSTLRPRLNVFFVVVISSQYLKVSNKCKHNTQMEIFFNPLGCLVPLDLCLFRMLSLF